MLRLQVEWLKKKLRELDHTVSAVHGDMDEGTREVMMREFQQRLLARAGHHRHVRAWYRPATGARALRVLFVLDMGSLLGGAPVMHVMRQYRSCSPREAWTTSKLVLR